MPEPLDIKIRTQADTSGADKAAAALGNVNAQAAKGAPAAADSAKRFSELGETMEKGSAAGRVLGEVTRGNLAALTQLGPVLKAIGQAFKANPLFLIGSIAAAVIIPAFNKIREGWQAQAEAAKRAGIAAEEALGKARKAAAEKVENELAKAFWEIAASAANAEKYINAVTVAERARVDAQEAVALAEIDADPNLTTEEKVRRKAGVQSEARQRRAAADLAALDQENALAQAAAAREAAKVDPARKAEQDARANLSRLRSPEQIRRELAENEKETEATRAQTGRRVDAIKTNTKLAELAQRRADMEAELAKAEENFAKQKAEAEAALKAAIEKRTAAEEAAAKAAEDAATTREVNQQRRAAIEVTTQAADKVGALTTEQAAREAAVKDAARAEREAAEANDRALLGDVADATPTIARNAQALEAGARKSGNTAVADAAKNLREAAGRAAEDGATEEELREMIAAAEAAMKALEASGQKSALLQKTITSLTSRFNALESQLKTLANNSQ